MSPTSGGGGAPPGTPHGPADLGDAHQHQGLRLRRPAAVELLFPSARIVFALRDPRDVVFSCFRRTFRLNAGMFEFLMLEGAARYHDAVMAVGDLSRGLVPLRITEVRHEDVVSNFDGEAGRAATRAGRPCAVGCGGSGTSRAERRAAAGGRSRR